MRPTARQLRRSRAAARTCAGGRGRSATTLGCWPASAQSAAGSPNTLRRWGIGFDGERITVPITDQRGALQGVLRLRVDAWQKPKVLAAAGSRLGLIPHPELVAGSVVLVEGPSDMLAARSAGLPAIAVPGTHAWRAEWASAFTGRDVTVVMDADRPGREAASGSQPISNGTERELQVVDLDPGRDDGYDLSDWLRAGNDPDLITDRLARAREAHADRRIERRRLDRADRRRHADVAQRHQPGRQSRGRRGGTGGRSKELGLRSVLIVEADDRLLRERADQLLMDGYEVHAASTGAGGADQARRGAGRAGALQRRDGARVDRTAPRAARRRDPAG